MAGNPHSTDKVSKLTSIGEVTYKKTYFYNPQTGERCYLLDRLLGVEEGERLTEDAIARIYDEAARVEREALCQNWFMFMNEYRKKENDTSCLG